MFAHDSKEAHQRYHQAGKLAVDAYHHVVSLIKPGVRLADLSQAGDAYIKDRSASQINWGVCHPTTVQVDEVVCNYTPTDQNPTILANTDIVKIQIGAHVDGYGAVVGSNTILPDASSESKALAKEAEFCGRLVVDLIKPGVRNIQLVEAIDSHLKGTGYQGVPGLQSHNHTKGDIQGPKMIDLWPLDRHADGIVFRAGEVYSVEIWLTDCDVADPLPDPERESTLHQLLPRKDLSSFPQAVKDVHQQVASKVGTFPFHDRVLGTLGGDSVSILREKQLLVTHGPYRLQGPGRIAQLTVSFVVTEDGTELLSPSLFTATS